MQTKAGQQHLRRFVGDAHGNDPRPQPMDRRAKLILIVLILVASALRVAGAFDDFWLDEIWSYTIAQRIQRPQDILLSPAARIDNNHPLNTMLMWFLGTQQNWVIYRIPSVLAGIGSVLMVLRIMRGRGAVETILAVALVGLSYPLIFFSSEARGYGLVVLFALVAFDAFQQSDRGQAGPSGPVHARSAVSWIVFNLACVLGLLSHLSFVHVYLGFLALSLYRLSRAPSGRGAVDVIRLHLPALTALTALYIVFVRKLTIGGAPGQSLWQGIGEAIARLIAVPGPLEMQIAVAAAAMLGFVMLLGALRRRGFDLWIMLLVAALLSPAAAILRQAMTLEHPQPMHARYFLVLLPIVIIAVSPILADLLKKRHLGPITAVLLAAFFVVNLWQTVHFIRIGRGHYSNAVVYMSRQTPGAILPVVSDHPLRTGMVLEFYSRLLPPGTQLAVIDATDPPPSPPPIRPQWLILHSNLTDTPPAPAVGDPWGQPYIYDREFTYYGLSGYSWYLYRRSER
jgi:hypothetical protein